MISREQQWSDRRVAYLGGERMFLPRQISDAFASVCLLLRDAPWAIDLFPVSSLGRLGITTSPHHEEWIVGCSAWLGVDEQGGLTVTYQEGLDQTRRTSRVTAFEPGLLQELAAWLRREHAHDG